MHTWTKLKVILLIFEYMIFSYLIHFILANLMLASFLSCSNRLRNFLNTIPPKVYFILRVNGISSTNWAFAFPLLRWSPRRFCTPIWFFFCIGDWHSYRASLDSEKCLESARWYLFLFEQHNNTIFLHTITSFV